MDIPNSSSSRGVTSVVIFRVVMSSNDTSVLDPALRPNATFRPSALAENELTPPTGSPGPAASATATLLCRLLLFGLTQGFT